MFGDDLVRDAVRPLGSADGADAALAATCVESCNDLVLPVSDASQVVPMRFMILD